MKNTIVERSIQINASPDKVWGVFTDPVVTRRMGGEYVSDWKVGSSFNWKGTDGKLYTYGEILQLENERLLKHSLFKGKDKNSVISVITYKLEWNNGKTTLSGREELTHDITDESYEEMVQGWDAALNTVKQVAENAVSI